MITQRLRGWRGAVAAAGAVAIAAAAIVIVRRGAGAASCDGAAAAEADEVWSSSRSEAVRAQLAGVDPAQGASRWAAATTALDRQAEAWRTVAADRCRAGGRGWMLADDGALCVARRRAALRAAVEALLATDSPAAVDRAVVVAARLAPVDGCATDPAAVDLVPGTEGDADLAAGSTAIDTGHPADAVTPLRRAIAAIGAAYGDDHLAAAAAWHLLASALAQDGKWADALAAYQDAARIRDERAGDSPELAATLMGMATALPYVGKHADAMTALERAVLILRDAGPEHRGQLAAAAMAEGRMLESYRKYREARSALDEAVAAYGAIDSHDLEHGLAILERGELARMQGDCAGALPDLQRAIDRLTADQGASTPFLLQPEADLGRCLIELGRSPEALAPLDRALAVPPRGGVEDVLAVQARFDRGRALVETGRDRKGGVAAARAARAQMATVTGAGSLIPAADLWLLAHAR